MRLRPTQQAQPGPKAHPMKTRIQSPFQSPSFSAFQRLLPTRGFLLAASLLAAGTASRTASAAVTTWSGGGIDDNWSTSANWSDELPAGNDVVFAAADATGTPGLSGSPNNIVDANTTLGSLKFTNTQPGNHTTEIQAGATLTVNGGGNSIEIQSPTNGSSDVVHATILGEGTLVANNAEATLFVGQGAGTADATRRATLDLSGLEEFSATLSQIVIGRQLNSSQPNRPQGTLRLARNNTLDLTANPGIHLGNNNQNNGNAADAQVLELGVSNTILSNNGIIIGGKKGNGYLRFNSEIVNPEAGNVVFRNRAGTGRQANWLIGDNSTQSGGGTIATGEIDFSTLGTVDALVGNLIVGRATGGTVTNFSIITRGSLTFDSGTIDANSLIAGIQPGSAEPGNASGTVNVNGTGKLLVNGNTTLGRYTGGGQFARGIINIGSGNGGGEVDIRGDVLCGLGSIGNKITVINGGTLRLGGFLGRPAANDGNLQTLDLEDSTLVFNFGAATNPAEPRANVENLITAGTVDIKVTGGNLTPGTVKLIEYTSLEGEGFPAFNLLPTIGITASLVDNSAEGSVDLVITEATSLTWAGTPNGNWDIAGTANWLTVPGNAPRTYAEIAGMGFQTTFDDTATGTKTVNLTTTLSPMQVFVDTDETYTFAGSGSISGGSALFKQGSGTLVLDATTTHSGATTISEGVLQIGAGGTTGALSLASAITNNATLAFNRSDTLTQGIDFAAALGGSGKLTQAGTGTLVLTGANSYTGATTVSQGILQVGIGGTDGTLGNNSHTSIAAGAELRINRGTGNFGYAYTGELSGDGTVSIPSSRRFNFQLNNQTASGSLSFIVNGILGINTSSGVTRAHLGELSGSGIIQRAGNPPAILTPTVLMIGGKNTNSTYSGNITNIAEFAVEKTGAGTLTLAGTYSHGGATTVTSGTLALGASATIPNSSSFTIAPAAVLDTGAITSFAMAASQPFTFGIDPAGSGTTGVLTAQGLDITNAVVSLDITGTLDDPAYVLATYTSLTGTAFATAPAVPTGYKLTYNYQGDKIALVQSGDGSLYKDWADGAAFNEDANGDGISNGLAFLLGATNPDANAHGLLPTATHSGAGLVITFTMRNAAARGNASLALEHSADLGLADAWTAVPVPDTSGGPVNGVTFTITPGTPLNTVTATIASGQTANRKLFARLSAIEN